jgi:UDP-perosamine 4-acetyltransferase
MQRLVLVGAGGHAKVVLEAVRAAEGFAVAGLLDPRPPAPDVLGAPVLGDDDLLEELWRDGVVAAVIALGNNTLRQQLARRARNIGFTLPAIVHPAGAVVMARAVIGTDTRVDELAIVNTGAVIDHDNEIGAAAHVATGCALAGMVSVGARVLVGVGSAVRPGVKIGSEAIVGAGSAVIADVPANALVGGTPARSLRRQRPP